MKKLTRHALTILTLLSVAICLPACNSVPQTARGNGGASSADLQSITAKQQEYDQLLKEWQALKPGLSRLLAIEEELHLLIGQLEQLSSSLEQNQNQKKIAGNQPPAPAAKAREEIAEEISRSEPTSYPVFVDVPTLVSTPVAAASAPATELTIVTTKESAPENHDNPEGKNQISSNALEVKESIANVAPPHHANFALQVASITEAHLLPLIWEKMIAKHPALLADMEPNFQKTSVRNADYYRLKVGSFSTQHAASQKCSHLKTAGVDCLVVGYTGSNFAQLTDAGKQITASVALQP